MNGVDPHIHVELNVMHGDAGTGDVLAATFGLVSDLPSVLTTGCRVRVPYSMTSPDPASVTCLTCREHASGWHRRLATQVERLAGMPGVQIGSRQASHAVHRHRELAERFSNKGR